MFQGKMKAVTFSYDDGVGQDIRFIEMLDKYGLKGTFNLNSGRQDIPEKNKVRSAKVAEVYRNHEVAVHTVDHVWLNKVSDEEVIRQVEQDRLALEKLVGYPICGMAYPYGNAAMDERVVSLIRSRTPIRYARGTNAVDSFDVQTDLLNFSPNVHHKDFDRLFAMGEKFINLKPETPKIFYIWGHTYEFDMDEDIHWDTMEEFCKLISINYHLNDYDHVHEKYPEVSFVATECCATGTTRDWYFASDLYGRIQDLDHDTDGQFLGREKTWKFFMERPYVIGCYQWAATEHRGEAMWPAVCSKSGALDLFLQKKGAFYQNQSHWTDEPMAHIVLHWNFKGLEGKEITVPVYTNCDELELFMNGKSQGRKQIEKYGHGEWKVTYEPGVLEVKGYRDGKLCTEDRRVTAGKAVSLRLTPDNEFEANGKDLALFTCECVDENGNIVPDAAEFVKFSVNAPAIIVGTESDNCGHNTVTNTERKMYMGKIRVAVRPASG